MADNRLEIILGARTSDANRALGDLDKQVNDTMGNLKAKAQEASLALGALGVTGAALTKSFISEANQMQKYEATLKAVENSAGAAKAQLEKLVQFAADAPAFDVKGVVEAGVKMRSFGADVDRFLPLAGDLAATFDRSLPEAAQALAKGLSGSQDGLTQLQDAFGVTKKSIIDFGAAVKSDGSIDTTQIDKLQDALEKVIKTKFGGVMMGQAQMAEGAFASLEDAVSRLKAALGKEIIGDFAGLATSLANVIEKVEALPDPIKRIIAQLVVLGTALATITAGFTGFIALLPSIITGWGALTAAITANSTASLLTTPITLAATKATIASGVAAATAAGRQAVLTTAIAAGMGPAVAAQTAFAALTANITAMGVASAAVVALPLAIAAGLVLYTHQQGQLNKINDEYLQQSGKLATGMRAHKDIILETANALKQTGDNALEAGNKLADTMRAMGKTDKDATKALLGIHEQIERAREDGNKDLEDKLVQRAIALKQAKTALAGTQVEKDKAAAEADAKAKKALEDRTAAIADYKEKASAGYYETSQAQLAALDKVLAKIPKEEKAYKDLALSRVKLARSVAKDEADEAEKARKAKLESALGEIDTLRAYGDKRLADQITVLKRILAEENITAEERKKIEDDLIATQEKLRNNQEQERKRRQHEQEQDEKKRQKQQQDSLKLEADLTQSKIKTSDATISMLRDQLAHGKDVNDQLKDELKTRADLTQQLIAQQAAAAKIGASASEVASIDKKAAEDKKAAGIQASQEAEKQDRDEAQRKKKDALEQIKLEQQLLDVRSQSRKTTTQGDLLNDAKQRLALTEQQLRAEADIAKQGATESEQSRISQQLSIDIFKARKETAEELVKATKELKAQTAEMQKQQGLTFKGVQSLDEMVNDMNSMFSYDKPAKAASSASPTMAETQQAAGQMGTNLKIEFVVPQGQPNDGWTYRSQQS